MLYIALIKTNKTTSYENARMVQQAGKTLFFIINHAREMLRSCNLTIEYPTSKTYFLWALKLTM